MHRGCSLTLAFGSPVFNPFHSTREPDPSPLAPVPFLDTEWS